MPAGRGDVTHSTNGTSNSASELPARTPTTAPRPVCRTDRASAAWRLGCAVCEGVVEAAWNGCNNLLEFAAGRGPEPYPEDLAGKVAIVTGGNAGIGLATAEQLARRGAHVVLACRDPARAQAAVQAIARATPLPGCCGAPPSPPSAGTASAAPSPPAPACPPGLRVEAMDLDLGRLDSVRRFAREWGRRGLPLHILVCNAGVMSPLTRTLTADGLEVQFQVNFLSHWLLANLLLEQERRRRGQAPATAQARPQLAAGGCNKAAAASPPADATRVVVVSSVVHRAGPLQWGDMQSEKSYEPYISYGMSKLATLVMAKELQRRFDRHPAHGPQDAAVAIHPGLVRTHLANNFFRTYALCWATGTPLQPLQGVWNRFIDSAGQAFLATTEQASRRMLHACLAPGERVAGRYLSMGRDCAPDKVADDTACAAELWGTAIRLTGHTPHPSLS